MHIADLLLWVEQDADELTVLGSASVVCLSPVIPAQDPIIFPDYSTVWKRNKWDGLQAAGGVIPSPCSSIYRRLRQQVTRSLNVIRKAQNPLITAGHPALHGSNREFSKYWLTVSVLRQLPANKK